MDYRFLILMAIRLPVALFWLGMCWCLTQCLLYAAFCGVREHHESLLHALAEAHQELRALSPYASDDYCILHGDPIVGRHAERIGKQLRNVRDRKADCINGGVALWRAMAVSEYGIDRPVHVVSSIAWATFEMLGDWCATMRLSVRQRRQVNRALGYRNRLRRKTLVVSLVSTVTAHRERLAFKIDRQRKRLEELCLRARKSGVATWRLPATAHPRQ